jgi:hypothetical protein
VHLPTPFRPSVHSVDDALQDLAQNIPDTVCTNIAADEWLRAKFHSMHDKASLLSDLPQIMRVVLSGYSVLERNVCRLSQGTFGRDSLKGTLMISKTEGTLPFLMRDTRWQCEMCEE